MLTVREFYAETRWRDEWNILRANGTRHRGHDIACAAHEDIPALRGGHVVARARSSALGDYLVLYVNGVYDYYCHLRSADRPPLSKEIPAGGKVGSAAGPRDYHGSSWLGAHLHFGYGPKVGSVRSGETYNATELIRSVLTQIKPLSGDVTPIPPEPVPEEEDDDMPKTSGFSYTTNVDGKTTTVYLIVNAGSGFYHEYSNGAGNGPMLPTYNNAVALAFDTNSFAAITEGHARVIKASCEKVLAARA